MEDFLHIVWLFPSSFFIAKTILCDIIADDDDFENDMIKFLEWDFYGVDIIPKSSLRYLKILIIINEDCRPKKRHSAQCHSHNKEQQPHFIF